MEVQKCIEACPDFGWLVQTETAEEFYKFPQVIFPLLFPYYNVFMVNTPYSQ